MSSLDGDGWQLKGWLGDEWRWYVNKPWDMPGWLPARVPGSVVDDLVRAGEVPSPYVERQSRLAEWVAERTWVYRRRVSGGIYEFQGVDHEATVFVDGEEVAHHVGSFTPFRVDVPPGEHLLAVAVHAAPESEAQVGKTSRVRVHKSRMGYGWDFCPRLVHQGIWRSVGEPRTYPRVTYADGIGRVELDGELLLEVEKPELWWPNGSGEQRLYRAGDFEVGFRTVELVPNEEAPVDALPYTLVVNGERTFIKGWNWVPVDVLYGVPRPEKLEHLLRLAAHAGVNMLRVWGGGVLESNEFYAHCDRLGILVWQEFSQSSSGLESTPSDDPEFVATLADDARQIVPRLAWHPSLFAWCGGNELAWPDREPIDERSPAVRALGDVVRELDPGRVWLPTSPTGPQGRYDMHGPWEHQGLRTHYEHYDSRKNLIHSEFGVEGMTNRRGLEALISEEHRWPADRSNPVYEHLGAWWNNAALVQEAFGGRIEDVETMRRASQWLQYDGLRYAVEATIRRAWRASGVLPWQFNESFPNAWCTCAVDWHGEPKPAYWGVRRAYQTAVGAQFATCAWGGFEEVRARVTAPAELLDLDGRVVAEGDGEIAAPLDAFAYDVFVLDVGGLNRYVMTRTESLAPLLDLPPTTLRRRGQMLENTGDFIALGVVAEADDRGAIFDDNVLDLLQPSPSSSATWRERRAGMLACSALAPDGSRVDGFTIDGTTVTYSGAAPVDAGIRLSLELPPTDDPQWLVPGVFYGENRPAAGTKLFPRFTPRHVDVARMESDAWSFRADRCATPAVFARGGGLVTRERSPLGQAGVGFAYRDGRPTIWLDFPYREEPLRYDGSDTPDAPDVQTYSWQPGERVTLEFEERSGDWRSELRPSDTLSRAGWVSVEEAAELAAYGLHRWHYKPDPARLIETRSFDGLEERDHMHVSWVSGAPYAFALLRHGRRVGNDEYVAAAEAVLDHIAGNLAPAGIYWPQWTHDRGWTWGWHADHTRAHARTVGDAARFMLRAGGRWEESAQSNIAVALRAQRDDGALPGAFHLETGEAVSWDGTAGMAWIPVFVEAGHLEEAHRAGEYYKRFDTWYGAPEDVDLAPTSEDGYAAVAAFVALEDWETARRAADWTLTFRYSYDVDFPAGTVLGDYAFKSTGADQASAANQHLHNFGLVCQSELIELGEPYRTSALQHLECFRQFIARFDGDFGARKGMAAERYLQTDVYGAKGTLQPLSHAWCLGVLLNACEDLLA